MPQIEASDNVQLFRVPFQQKVQMTHPVGGGNAKSVTKKKATFSAAR